MKISIYCFLNKNYFFKTYWSKLKKIRSIWGEEKGVLIWNIILVAVFSYEPEGLIIFTSLLGLIKDIFLGEITFFF